MKDEINDKMHNYEKELDECGFEKMIEEFEQIVSDNDEMCASSGYLLEDKKHMLWALLDQLDLMADFVSNTVNLVKKDVKEICNAIDNKMVYLGEMDFDED